MLAQVLHFPASSSRRSILLSVETTMLSHDFDWLFVAEDRR
jgi:hypothetical protein